MHRGLSWMVRLEMFLARGSFIRDSEVNKRVCVCACVRGSSRLWWQAEEMGTGDLWPWPDLRSMMDWMWSSNPFDKLSFSTTSSFSVWLQRRWDWFTGMFCFIVFLSFLWTTNYVSPIFTTKLIKVPFCLFILQMWFCSLQFYRSWCDLNIWGR